MDLRVLVVDDTAIYRKVISDALAAIPGIEVIGTASNGKSALARIQTLRPDMVTLDIEMPEMDGLEVLEAIKTQGIDVGVIVLSAFTRHGSELTIRALELGAFDFLTKASEGDFAQNTERLKKSLAPLLKVYGQRREIRAILKGTPPAPAQAVRPEPKAASTVAVRGGDIGPRMQQIAGKARAEMVLIGISTGGPNALAQVLPKLPANLGVPVLVVQHMPALFTQTLAESLNKQCALRVKEAEAGETALANVIYIAPGGKQMKLAQGTAGKPQIQITDDPPENNCRPAVDYLFRSAAFSFPGRACAVIMTGMGSDGTVGLRLLKRSPTWVIAQDEASCVVFGMPKEAIAAGVVDVIVPLDGIAAEMIKAVQG